MVTVTGVHDPGHTANVPPVPDVCVLQSAFP